jgi:hypothetical protein
MELSGQIHTLIQVWEISRDILDTKERRREYLPEMQALLSSSGRTLNAELLH